MSTMGVSAATGPRRILIASKYLHQVGGVETYIEWLGHHLPKNGYEVAFFGMRPPDGESYLSSVDRVFEAPFRDFHVPGIVRAQSAASSVYSRAAARTFSEALDQFKPDMIHFQSVCYQLTSSVVRVANRRDIPTLTTAHEYKFVCSNQRLWDDLANEPCTACLEKDVASRTRAIVAKRCVKGRLGPSLIAAAELPVWERTWKQNRGLIHAPSRFMADLLDSGSAVRGRVEYADLAWGEPVAHPEPSGGPKVCFTGRLSKEKGVAQLLEAWPEVVRDWPNAELWIYGSGNHGAALKAMARELNLVNVTFPGPYDRGSLGDILGDAAVTVHPSIWAENSPYTVRESLNHGVPAVVSDMGGLPEMVSQRTGQVFQSGDTASLARAIGEELRLRRARTDLLREAVAQRATSDDTHLTALRRLYAGAYDTCRRAR